MDIFKQPAKGEQFHSLLHSLRARGPVMEVNYDNRDVIFILGYDALKEAFQDAINFPPHAMYQFNTEPYVGKTVMSSPEPDHSIFRKLSTPAFKLNSIAGYGEELIRSICIELLEPKRDEIDLVADFARRLPTLVISRMLGLPVEVERLFEEWSIDILYRTSLDNAQRWSGKLGTYLQEIIDQKRRNPQDDVISQLVTASHEGRSLTDEEIISHIRLLMPVGADPVYHGLSNALCAIFSEESLYRELKGSPDLIPKAVEESFRWEAPIALLPRLAGHTPFQYYGCNIKPFQPVFFGITGAHRDPGVFESPDHFNLHRQSEIPLLTFGPGHKHCPGIHLAKLEITTAIRVLLEFIDEPEIVQCIPSSEFIFRVAKSVNLRNIV